MGTGLVLLQLIACPVEQLGIELPEGGADAVSHEDLRRDTRLLLGPDPAATFAERLGQMQMIPVAVPPGLPNTTLCAGRGDGGAPGDQPRLLVATWPATADEATAAAALISIAKAWDLEGAPKGRATLCLLPQQPASAAVPLTAESLWIGSIASGELVWTPGRVQADPADPARPPEKINYTEVQARVKAIFLRL